MKKEHETMMPTPAELRERWALEDQPKLIDVDWEGYLAERRRFGLDRSLARSYEHGVYQLEKSLRKHKARKLKERRRALEMKISEDYWGTKPPRSANRGVKELLSVSKSFDPIWVDYEDKTAFFDESEKLIPTPKKRVWYHQTPQIRGRTFGFIFTE